MSSCRQWKAKAQPSQAEHQPNLPARRAGNGSAEEASAAAPSGFEAPVRQDGSRRQRHRHQSAAWGSWSNYGYGPWQSWPTWNPADGFSNSDWYAGPNTHRSREFRAHRPQAQSVEIIPESASAGLRPEQLLRRSQRQSETRQHSFVPADDAAAPDANDADADDGGRPSSGSAETTTTPSAVVEDADAETNPPLRPGALSAPTAAPAPPQQEEEGEKIEKVLSEEPRSWLTGAPDGLAYIEDFLAQTNEPQVVEDWEDMAEDLAEDREPPWYNVPYLLRYRFREPIADTSLEGLPSLGRRPKPAVPLRAPGRDLVAAIKDVSGEGLALGLSPLSAVANYGQAFAAGVSASGSWDKVELLPWSLLHPAGPPSWGEGREATVRWRFHVVDLRAKPTEFHAGNKNLLHLTDGTGNWEQTKLLPGILTVEICLQRSLPLHVQVGPCQQREGQADEHEVRALVLADKLCLCLDHRRPETGLHCFCPEALLAAAAPMPAASEVVNWDSTADYMASWRPAVELEAAASAADEDDTRTLSNVDIAWGEKGLGSFVVPSALASAHRMKMRGLIRGEDGPTEWSSGWLCLRLPAQQSGGIGWRGHAGIVDADLVGDDGNAQPLAVVVGEEEAQIPQTMSLRISFQMVPGASDSSGTPRTRKAGYIIEFIPKSLPYSCMAVALAELSSASPLLREVVLQARAPAPGAAPGPAAAQQCLDDEASWHSETRESFAKSMDLKPWRLNPPQEAAVRGSLEDALSLIHGPPGTGKTTTAAALCVLYALWNLDCGQVAAVLYCTPSNDAADVACIRVAESSARHFQALATKRRQEVVAAGTSEDCPICFNGSCDAITACGHQFHRSCLEQARAAGNSTCPLCRRPLRQSEGGLTALRVYSAEMERGDFPVPKRIDHPSAKPRKVKTVSEAMRPFALHWRCHGRAPGVEPTAESLEAGAAYERMLQAGLSSPLFDELRTEYYLALSAARAAELRRTDVVFATCISARRGGLAAALQAPGAPELLQVVLDEAGQAPEPEALCPMTLAKNAKKIVMVGDPKQLRPIVTSPQAERMGLNISLLERLSDAPAGKPRLLSLQYRMHEELNEFPAAYFYGGRVRTDPAVLARRPGRLAHPTRPMISRPFLFWSSHGGPSEQISQVRSSAASAKSRFNPAEALRAAALARSLAAKVGDSRVAVLTWYNAQVAQLSEALAGTSIHIGGVVSSQGNEWDYVLLSTVRSSPGGLGALEDEHLLDVALTRARLGMCVLGAPETLRRIHAWSCLLDHCETRGLVTTSQPVVMP
ncbi:HELZ2 [Symbiodinium sp. CCMP2592]|nr:HELZ2 [Symbiodinium sp. CCMP2592]